ncbi:hypothetical protein PR048_008756 [Dryococelus australis]|uniref:Uncharacterized protein n=1 Tax=Dryococelus australis TaxID=614101 RepID=A0ABQ9HY02_9NEOP|nr:hypothetical protein PR048_008756 [Dryococelus australis]
MVGRLSQGTNIYYAVFLGIRGCGGWAVSLLSSHQGELGSIPGWVTPDFCKWESCWMVLLVGGFSKELPFPLPLHSGAAPLSPHFTLICSQGLIVKSHPNVSTQLIGIDDYHVFDVVIHLTGWSDKQEWSQHYTTGGKLVFEGSGKNIHFYKNREPLARETQTQNIGWIFHELKVELGMTQLSEAIWEILNYPYRAGSSKALVFVVGQPAEVGQLTNGLIQTVGAAIVQQWLYVQGIYPFVITPVEGLKISSKDAKALKNIVGFDDEHVYSLTDGRKKQGNTELRKILDYKPNPLTWLPQGNFIDNKAQRRQYVQTVSHRISESLTSEFYEDCVCFIKDGMYAESFCRVTGRKERETPVPYFPIVYFWIPSRVTRPRVPFVRPLRAVYRTLGNSSHFLARISTCGIRRTSISISDSSSFPAPAEAVAEYGISGLFHSPGGAVPSALVSTKFEMFCGTRICPLRCVDLALC